MIAFYLALIAAVVQADTACNIKVFEVDKYNWGNMSAGFLLGLHPEVGISIDSCPECGSFATSMQQINYGLAYVLTNKDKWINQAQVTQLDINSSLPTLLAIYQIFMVFLLPLDSLMQDKKLMYVPVQVFNIFLNPSLFETLVTNFIQKGTEMLILILTIPGSSCFTIGYRAAALSRFIFGVTYGDLP